MARKIRITAKLKEESCEVKTLITHPMETGFRLEGGALIPKHFITEIRYQHNGITVMEADLSIAVAKNPYFFFRFKGGGVGDEIRIDWWDNLGGSDSQMVLIK